MTTENPDEVTQEQQNLDGEQGAPATPTYVTAEDLQKVLSEVQRQGQQVSSLQGMVQKGFNTVQQNNTVELQKAMASLQQQQDTRRILEMVPEENREWVQALMQSQNVQQPAQTPVAQTPVDTGMGGDMLNAAIELAEQNGVPRAQITADALSIITDPSIPDEARAVKYLMALGEIKAKGAVPAGTVVPQQPQSNGNQKQTPPVDGGGAGRGSVLSIDDIREQYITDQIDEPTARARAAAIGQTL